MPLVDEDVYITWQRNQVGTWIYEMCKHMDIMVIFCAAQDHIIITIITQTIFHRFVWNWWTLIPTVIPQNCTKDLIHCNSNSTLSSRVKWREYFVIFWKWRDETDNVIQRSANYQHEPNENTAVEYNTHTQINVQQDCVVEKLDVSTFSKTMGYLTIMEKESVPSSAFPAIWTQALTPCCPPWPPQCNPHDFWCT